MRFEKTKIQHFLLTSFQHLNDLYTYQRLAPLIHTLPAEPDTCGAYRGAYIMKMIAHQMHNGVRGN